MSDVAMGLGAVGFWLFIAAVVVAGIWYDARRKESQQETLRRLVESGRDLDQDVIDRVTGTSDAKDLERDLKIGAYIVGAVAPGLFLFSLFLGRVDENARAALMGVSALVACVSVGLYLAARFVERRTARR